MYNILKFTIMYIIIGIILIFVGIGVYSAADRNGVANDWLCMLGFLLMMTGGLMIGLTMDGKM